MVPRLKALLKHRDEALVGERKQVRLYEVRREPKRERSAPYISKTHAFSFLLHAGEE